MSSSRLRGFEQSKQCDALNQIVPISISAQTQTVYCLVDVIVIGELSLKASPLFISWFDFSSTCQISYAHSSILTLVLHLQRRQITSVLPLLHMQIICG